MQLIHLKDKLVAILFNHERAEVEVRLPQGFDFQTAVKYSGFSGGFVIVTVINYILICPS